MKDRGNHCLGAFPVSATGETFFSTTLPSELSSARRIFEVGLEDIPARLFSFACLMNFDGKG